MEIPCIVDYEQERRQLKATLAKLEDKLKALPEPEYAGITVNHKIFGTGRVEYRRGDVLPLRFQDGTTQSFSILECTNRELVNEVDLEAIPDMAPRMELHCRILKLRNRLLQIQNK